MILNTWCLFHDYWTSLEPLVCEYIILIMMILLYYVSYVLHLRSDWPMWGSLLKTSHFKDLNSTCCHNKICCVFVQYWFQGQLNRYIILFVTVELVFFQLFIVHVSQYLFILSLSIFLYTVLVFKSFTAIIMCYHIAQWQGKSMYLFIIANRFLNNKLNSDAFIYVLLGSLSLSIL